MASCMSALLGALSSSRSLAAEKSGQVLEDDQSGTSTLIGLESEKRVHASSGSTDTSAQLDRLRTAMRQEALDFYIIPTDDAHGSEYTAPADQRRSFISGFTGSAGTAIVTLFEAHLFTDGRYHVQAEKQLDRNWTLHKVGQPGVKDWEAFLLEEATPEASVGFDARIMGYAVAKSLIENLERNEAQVMFPSRNLVDVAWGKDRPAPMLADVYEHELKYAGKPAQDKLAELKKYLSASHPAGSAYFISALDEIAWLLNLRGASIPCNPVFPAYLIVNERETVLFVDDDLLKNGSDARSYVENQLQINVKPYDAVWDFLLAGNWKGQDDVESINLDSVSELPELAKLVSGEKISWAAVNAVGDENVVILLESPIALAKAQKNATELAGLRAAYLRDGAAWARWAAWLEERVAKKRIETDEWTAAVEFRKVREQVPLWAGMESYDAISASGENAALPHYETPEKNSRIIDRKTPYLNDSGAQYFDGTIDTTRTVHFGKPTEEQKRAFTRVLQGHIAIDTAVFPEGTTGAQLDVLARGALWKDGMNYLHGTGHGIGSFLNVHEGPQGFSTSSGGARLPVPLLPGMALSNEPGYYEQGSYGIRTESIVIVHEVKTRRDFGGKKWFGFERITMVPIDTRLVSYNLLSRSEKAWLKAHNETVKRAILPLVKEDRRARDWLKRQ